MLSWTLLLMLRLLIPTQVNNISAHTISADGQMFQEEIRPDDKHSEKWRVDRRIPLSLIITIVGLAFIQTATAAWFFSSIDKRVEVLERAQVLSAPQAERLARLEEKVISVQDGVADIKHMLEPILRQRVQNYPQ